MSRFDLYLAVDWSGGNGKSARPQKDAIWIGETRGTRVQEPLYQPNRQIAEDTLAARIEASLTTGQRALIGFDFPFAYPQGFGLALTGQDDPLAVWDWLAERISDSPKTNNRFALAAEINRGFDAPGPFWGHPRGQSHPGLSATKPPSPAGFAERRGVEQVTKGAFTCWQLLGAGAVGSQVLMGLPVLARLRQRFPGQIAVWPFERLDRPIAFVEIWPSLLADQVRAEQARGDAIRDAIQVRLTADLMARLDASGDLEAVLAEGARGGPEGWIFGVGQEAALARVMGQRHLSDDCFALPPGVHWTPVAEALDRLDRALKPVTEPVERPLAEALGTCLSAEIRALRANPPAANSAVDGYGFAHGSVGQDARRLPLAEGRAAAGSPFCGAVPKGHAVRILTGALLPKGVDTVLLEEDCTADRGDLVIPGLPKPGANTRAAGEDVTKGATLFPPGHRLRPADLALAAATGHARLPVRKLLRVGVLSTGDELAAPDPACGPEVTFDANRPMLLSSLAAFGHEAVDLGHAPDDRAALRACLDQGVARCDAILTSGGASAGDEDHVSAILRAEGRLHSWRIALKPGRPLVLAQWRGLPVFGLPGNPVAALVCTLIFARPALSKLAGGVFAAAQGREVPAAFTKRKKAGRSEFLRARLTGAGAAEVFASEGSGRISGLSWAEGLVELPHEAIEITPGDPVRFISYAEFGIG